MSADRRPLTRERETSPLRQARLAMPKTLEEVCADLDLASEDGSSGVTPSMLSGWELGRRVTSVRYRKLLSEYYHAATEDLFAHQDAALSADGETPQLLVGHRQLHHAMVSVVRGARSTLAIAGSRSRDAQYLTTIEQALADGPQIVHYRVLFGPPRHHLLTDHLLRLVKLRGPDSWDLGVKTLNIGIIDNELDMPERFYCASESAAVVPIPPLTSIHSFDSGVLFGPQVAGRLIDHTRQAYAAARRVETPAALRALPLVGEAAIADGQVPR